MEAERWRRITELFAAALELSGEERARFLATESGGDPALSAAVERMLAADEEAGEFLARPAELPPPQRIGRYEIASRIGRGGFGEVFQGWDPVLKRPVAVKTCLLGERDLGRRFSREAEIAASLDHPNITVVHDFGEQDGVPFLVQELLAGEDLDRVIAGRQPLSLGARLDLLIQVARGLAYAHARGVIHRDVKPGNVRMLPDGRAKIMDFGIARLTRGAATRLTHAGAILGTAAYMAPEQIRGEDAGEASDVYSFGAVAYELVAGICPFRAESGAALLYQVLERQAEPLRAVWRGCPPALAALVERCLAKDPEARPPGAPALLAELEEIARGIEPGLAAEVPPAAPAEGEPSRPAPPAAPGGRTSRSLAPRRARPLAAGAAALVALALLAWAVLWRPRAAPAAGTLLVDARPWAEVRAVTGPAGAPLPLPEGRTTPLALELPPGTYTLALGHPSAAEPRSCRVTVVPGGTALCEVEFARVEAGEFLAGLGW